MTGYRYHEPQRYDRATATRALHADDPAVVCDALVGVTFHDGDWRWVQGECVRLARHPASGVRGLAATCIGHLARIHGVIDRAVIEPVLARLAADADPDVAGRVSDARDDIATFIGGALGNRPPAS